MNRPGVVRVRPAAAVAEAGAEQFVALAELAIREQGRFTVALSGGRTPEAMYRLLAMDSFLPRVDWEHVFLFWSDERCVPPESPESNFRLAVEAFLHDVPIPDEQIFRLRGELAPENAAADYEHDLRRFFFTPAGPPPFPRFDLILLGLGEDGHTASLFPGTAAVHESERWVVANYVDKLATWRLTFTIPVINAAANVLFLVTGANKAAILREALYGNFDPIKLPAQFIEPAAGNLHWLVDEAAGAELNR